MSTGTSNRDSAHVKKMLDHHGFLGPKGYKFGNALGKVVKEIPLVNFREVTAGSVGSQGTTVYEVPFAEMYEMDEASSTADSVGAQLADNTTPALGFVSADAETTPAHAMVVQWAAGNVDAVLFQVPLEDFDGSQNVTLTVRGKMASSNDTPAIYSKIVVDEADTVVADTSSTFYGSATGVYVDHTITIAAADLPATGKTVSVRLTPAAHDTDILYVSSVKMEYGTLATADQLGGLLTSISTPALNAENGDTDGQWRIKWAASDSSPIAFMVALEDIDTDEDMQILLRLKSGGTTNSPTVASDAYFNGGDTKVEDTSAASAAAVGNKAITIASADIPSAAAVLSVELTPGAHTTDALNLYAAWVVYCRKFPCADTV
jgi:hypothetical protein